MKILILFTLVCIVIGCEDRDAIKNQADGDYRIELENAQPPRTDELESSPHDNRRNLSTVEDKRDAVQIEKSAALSKIVNEKGIPNSWLSAASVSIRKKIENDEFVWETHDGDLVLGVTDESGKFISWEGAQSFEGGSTGYFVLPAKSAP